MRRPKFERGDIVRVNLHPTSGHEQQGHRPALVLSTDEFNKLGLVLVAPITQGGDFSRHAGFAAPLTGSGTETQGVVLMNHIRTLDLASRDAEVVEKAPEYVVDDALARLQAIIA